MFKQRKIFKEVLKTIDSDKIVAIGGSRRVGKTELLKAVKSELMSSEEPVLMIELKKPKELMKLNEDSDYISELIGTAHRKKTTVIIDDIDLLANPNELMRVIGERYLDFINIAVSYTDNEKIDENIDIVKYFKLKPLDFAEFIIFKGFTELLDENNGFLLRKVSEQNLLTKIKVLFSEFIKYGAYPEIVLSESENDKKEKLNEFLNNLLQKDISAEGIKDVSKLYLLLKLLAEKSSELLNSNECSKSLNVSITAIENYLKVLEKLSVISRIKPFYGRYDKELKKMPVVYFNDLGIRNAVLGTFTTIEDRFDKENYFKNVLFKILSNNGKNHSIKFWKTQSRHEVDFIIDEEKAVVSKFNSRLFKVNKYKKFHELYPEINLCFVGYKENAGNVLSYFDFLR